MLITFEGPDGCGKTTQIALLADYLGQQGLPVMQTREPGGTVIGERIREVLHDPAHEAMSPQAEILLYSASRAQLVAEVLRPALERGQVVLCDRFYDSTFAYQGYGHGLDLAALQQITRFATGGLRPDLTFYLDIDPVEGLRRRQRDEAAEWNRLDKMALDFHRRVHSGYRKLAAAEPDRWLVIDAARDIEAVQAEIRALALNRLAGSAV